MYAYQSNNYGFSSFRDYLRRNGYNKFLKSSVIGPQYIDEKSWNYDAIICEYIDKDFKPEDEWITNKILDDTQSRYPLGAEFLREQYEKTYQMFRDFMNNL